MKAVMLSIQPKWCELITNGKKTIEVRKTKPKLETPFKCYIYCTKPRMKLVDIIRDGEDVYGEEYHGKTQFIKVAESSTYGTMYGKYQKVIGEFVCYDISKYETEFYPPKKQPVYEAITEWTVEDEVYEAVASNCDTYQTNFLKSTCMALEDFREYLGIGEIPFYGWHISNLVIYDQPKELSEFYRLGKPLICDGRNCENCNHLKYMQVNSDEWDYDCDCQHQLENRITLKRPPQSWCYVEEISGEKHKMEVEE